ncbi:MAG: hypothetical protein A2W33_01865 [Chloroflexi bacterium RBG_16_52_11]|nr:MAG: hypothetical protein A2W33_01865 [Chloroflexi bacterium RBG_16_52_11]
MYGIRKAIEIGKHERYQSDTTADSPEPNPADPWLFTDPQARIIYQTEDRLRQLEEDICTYVMTQGQWAPEDIECKYEIRRLLHEELLKPDYSFGYLSPHPTVYHAMSNGKLNIASQHLNFKIGDEIVFEPWLSRVANPGHVGPIWVGRVKHITGLCLCSEAFPLACIHCDRTVAILRQTLKHSRTH